MVPAAARFAKAVRAKTSAFGDDGSASQEANPIHVFSKAGTYTVRLTASNGLGSTASSQSVTVGAAPAGAIATAAVLIKDLQHPERFYYILTRPNWRSWMARGAFLLTAHGALSSLWLAAGWRWKAAMTVPSATSMSGRMP